MSNTPTTKLQHLVAGQPLQISASSWNKMAKHCETPDGVNELPLKPSDSNTVILCKNVSGVDILPFWCVKVNSAELANIGSVLGNSYNATPTILGGARAMMPIEDDFLGITQERINNGECGYVLVHGITPLRYNEMLIPPTYAEEQANIYYLSPVVSGSSPCFACTQTPAKIRLLKYHTSENATTMYPVVYLDNGVALPKPYFGYTTETLSNWKVNLTFDSFTCTIVDYDEGAIYNKIVPPITVNDIVSLWGTHKYNLYLVYKKHTDTFDIFAGIEPSDEFFCPIGYQHYTRVVNTCFSKPILYPTTTYTIHSAAFNITQSLSDGTITIGQGTALIVGTGISKSWSSTSLSVDSSGNAFVAGATYHIYAEYDLTNNSFAVVARKDATTNRRLVSGSDKSVALIGNVIFGYAKNQMFKGSYLPMFLNINMRNPTS